MRRKPRHARITGMRALEMLREIDLKRGRLAREQGLTGEGELTRVGNMFAEHIRAELVKARRK